MKKRVGAKSEITSPFGTKREIASMSIISTTFGIKDEIERVFIFYLFFFKSAISIISRFVNKISLPYELIIEKRQEKPQLNA